MALTRVGGAVKSDRIFDTVAAMVASKTVKVGDIVETAGYTTVNDGGGAKYEIVAAATGTDDGGSFIDLDSLQAKLMDNGEINIKQYGAKGDGVTNDTTAFVNAALTGKKIYVPGATYIVTYDNIVCADGTDIYGEGTLKDLSVPVVSANNPNHLFIRVTTNNNISGLTFVGDDNRLFAVGGISSTAVGTVKKIRVSSLKTEKAGIFICEPENGFTFNNTEDTFVDWINSGPVTSDMISEDIIVKDCIMEGDTTYTPSAGNTNTSQAHGTVFNFAKNCESLNNHVKNARFGNWAYGGGVLRTDGYTASNNTVWNENIKFIGGSASECFSTYWMSKTKGGVITGTTTDDYEDVVIDFEGCESCSATGNTTLDRGHGAGALTALAGCRDITFTGNVCTITAGTSANMNNSFIGNKNVIWSSNVFSAYGSVTPKFIIRNSVTAVSTVSPTTTENIQVNDNVFINVDCLFEEMEDISFRGNRLQTDTNTNAIRFFNVKDLNIENNVLNLTTDSALAGQSNSPVQSILSGKSYDRIEINSNRVYGTTGESGITVFGAMTSSCTTDISNNKTNAIFLDNSFIFSVANQLQGRVIFLNNNLPVPTDTDHIGRCVLKSIGGSASTNAFITYGNSTPATGTWNVGDIIYDSSPTTGGFIGWVCTTGGTPGTWKTFGVIS